MSFRLSFFLIYYGFVMKSLFVRGEVGFKGGDFGESNIVSILSLAISSFSYFI